MQPRTGAVVPLGHGSPVGVEALHEVEAGRGQLALLSVSANVEVEQSVSERVVVDDRVIGGGALQSSQASPVASGRGKPADGRGDLRR